MGPSDPDLADRAKHGDREAFAELVRRHQATIRGMLRRLTANVPDGDDLSQATFLRAWVSLQTYSGGTFRAWLCAIAYREFLQAKRKTASRLKLEDGADILAEGPSAVPPDGLSVDLDTALTRLTDVQRVAVTLCLGAGLSHAEAALATGWPLGTVKSHVTRGRAELRKLLSSYGAA